jgi:putative peptidoglycan lipid II flippase
LEANSLFSRKKNPQFLSSVLVVTGFTILGQGLGFITQVVIASLFGASAGMDAFLAASAVPQYVISVLLGSLGFVFVPVFVDYLSNGREDEAWEIASSIINFSLLVLGILVALGLIFPELILGLTAPGLSYSTHRQAVQIAVITWPSVLATGIVSLLTGIYQSQSRFGWPAAVPVIGAITNLILVVVLARWFGITGLAIATTLGIVLQVGLLLPLALKKRRYKFLLDFHHPAVVQILLLLIPLALSNVIAKSTPIVDRFLASGMSQGSISHLGYASRILHVLIMLISTGIATVIFPRMAFNVANTDVPGLKRTMSSGLRLMWLAIAPVMTIGVVLAFPLVMAVFQRGQFNANDSMVVAGLLQVYLLSLAPACLGNITGRGFYVLKEIRIFSILSSLESVAYIFYTAVLAHYFGPLGVALGYVLFFNISFSWTLIILRYKTGNVGGRVVLISVVRTGLAALLGGFVTWSVMQFFSNVWLELILGGMSGLLVYSIGLWFLQFNEINQLWKFLRTENFENANISG